MAEVELETRTSPSPPKVKTSGQCIPTGMTIKKKKKGKIVCVGEDIEKLEPSCIPSSECKMVWLLWKTVWHSSKN